MSRLADAGRLIAAGRYDPAIRMLAECDDPGRHALLGAAWLGRRKAGPALEHLQQALALAPGDPPLQFALAKARLLALDAPAAVALLEDLAARDAGLPDLTATLASAYRHDARFAEAARLAATVADPGPSLLYEWALCLLQLGQGEDSLARFDRLLAINPRHAAGWYWSHAPALELGGWAEAERRLARAAAIPGANRKYLGMLAAYDRLRDAALPRPCPPACRHLADGARAVRAWGRAPPRLFGVPASLLRYGLAQTETDGLVCEFGVRRGNSIRWLAEGATAVHGFDSFVGLPDAWVKAPAGVLSAQGALPQVAPNVRLHPGWFADSLPPFLAAHDGPLRFANIDCDVYSSTRTVLWALAERMVAGTVLVFDELIGNRSWRQDEFKALSEFAAHFRRDFALLAVNPSGKQVAIRLH